MIPDTGRLLCLWENGISLSGGVSAWWQNFFERNLGWDRPGRRKMVNSIYIIAIIMNISRCSSRQRWGPLPVMFAQLERDQ
jgi:hypothetical protein